MAKSQKKKGGETFDRQTLYLIIIVFVVGIFVGFLFGKRAQQTAESYPAPVERERPAERQKKPRPKPSKVKTPARPQIAIVIDDIGYDHHLEDLLFSLPAKVTLAVIPGLTYSERFAKVAEKEGFEVIIHQPMEAQHEQNGTYQGMIETKMDNRAIESAVKMNLKSIPQAVGMSNHMGSYATQDRRVMDTVFSVLKDRHLFFLDSMTTSLSVGKGEAKKVGVSYLQRDIFLDNNDDADYIRSRLHDVKSIAGKTGTAIGIGHYKWSTLSVLKEELPKLEEEGFEIVPLKKLL
ncbi:MAG: hypothetical protein COV74_06750 [Candidatus Omnitrophica bacterium CG11_big_fil_rev_8_21_14_0_20_45_26]|uniref:Divergent polysaccharide deacetylase family protein n=1 Tax=Candidatus Abzuiibacterium crystallinum TaxID=1974748 RepID=A0A2H0LQA9_9BACT|nr:MAG: hypothetical protein COV74_06750 [Candidatus Omnitrophica bacterium CG11_big_fil_rev_8_21_14_0_20_45_26]PIW65074.1 MAG: hypothetical protein COW12_03450 [Candidatus Omnitrophica bacterium CG12_big_fil_rev_8_21_14_0_65_45_16]